MNTVNYMHIEMYICLRVQFFIIPVLGYDNRHKSNGIIHKGTIIYGENVAIFSKNPTNPLITDLSFFILS